MATNFFHDDVYDAALDEIEANANAMHVCSGDPTDRAGVIAASLGNYAMTSGDYTKGDGTPNGRKLDIAAKSGNNATASGDATCVCHIDGTRLLYKVDLPADQTVTSGNPLNVNAHSIRMPDVA